MAAVATPSQHKVYIHRDPSPCDQCKFPLLISSRSRPPLPPDPTAKLAEPSASSSAPAAPSRPEDAWKTSGVQVIPSTQLDSNTPQTPGMTRAAAVNFARTGAQKLWAGTVQIHPNAKTGAHHHGHLESVIYVLKGRARMRWGEKLEFTAEAGEGDFIYVPPYVPHQEINAMENETLECVLMRSDSEAIAVNLPDVEPVEKPETVHWVDPTHPHPDGGHSH